MLWLLACSSSPHGPGAGTSGTAGRGASDTAGTTATGSPSGGGAGSGPIGSSGIGGSAGAGGTAGRGASASGGAGALAASAGKSGSAGAVAGSGAGTSGQAGSSGQAGASGGDPTYEQVQGWISAYKTAHPGNGGKDWDINAKTPTELAADPAAQQLLSLCGPGQRPVIPLLAWEYGGSDHSWVNPEASALVYCVYIPVNPSTPNWSYDAGMDRVTADVYVRFPDQNPCKDQTGKDQVAACIGDSGNFEILVDTASLNDGADAGLSLSNASTELKLILPDMTKVQLIINL
jgi:hypothetical protein